jgi:hypothetical protein
MVVMNALTDFERPRMAHQLAQGGRNAVMKLIIFLRLVLVAAWVATALTIVVLTVYAPGLVLPTGYGGSDLLAGTALWMTVAGVRVLRTAESAFLQAVGAFKPLALCSVISSSVSVAAVTITLLLGGPVWSIAGILVGEAVFTGWIRLKYLAAMARTS